MLKVKYCSRCGDTVLHDDGMCTKCAFLKVGRIQYDETAVRCPVCLSFFIFQKNDPRGDRHQIELPLLDDSATDGGEDDTT